MARERAAGDDVERRGTRRDTRARDGARRRVLLVAAPLVLVALCALDLVVRGRSAVDVVATNLASQPASSGVRVIDRVRPTAPAGRVYRVVVTPAATAAAAAPTHDATTPAHANARAPLAGARAQLQLESNGRTRIVLVQPERPDASRLGALRGLLTGRANLQVVDDREWIDLGPLPDDGAPLRVHVIGLLPGAFAFAELDQPSDGDGVRFGVTLVPSGAPVVTTTARYRIVRAAPVPALETLARATFFVRTSGVLLVATLLALTGLCAGFVLLFGGRSWSGVAVLVSSVAVLHAALLPPLQGADETSQLGTIEWLLRDPSPERAWRYPDAVARVALALEQDRVQYAADQPLPLADAAARGRLAGILRSPTADEGTREPPDPPAATLQVIPERAPLFFAPYPFLRGALLRLPVLDRIAAYRLIATAWCLLLFACGLALLRASGLPGEIAIAYGLVFLLPYAVGIAATCSNYAPALGLGFLFAAAAVSAISTATPGMRLVSVGTGVAATWAGVPLWPDFLALALAASALALTVGAAGLVSWSRIDAAKRIPPARVLVLAVVPLAGAAAAAYALFPDLNQKLRLTAASWDLAQLSLRGALLGAPLALAVVAAAFCWSLHRLPDARRRRRTQIASAAIALALLVGFILAPYAEVPYERVFLPLGELVRAHATSFLASSFSFDQDRLGWKFLFGAFGWHDAYYPELVYAAARWTLTALVIALPLLVRDVAATRPHASIALLLVAGVGGSLAVATLLARHAMLVHPHGRFALPYLALIALPVLALIATPARRRVLRAALVCGVALNVWTAIVVLGARYALTR